MPDVQLFSRLGLFVHEDALGDELRVSLRAEVCAAAQGRVRVVKTGESETLDEDTRRTRRADMSAATLALVEARLLAIKPAIERHFDLPLHGCQPPQFLIYGAGDHFGPHCDSDDDCSKPAYVKERRISVVIFLNGGTCSPPDETYEGGALVLYGLVGGSAGRAYGIPLAGEPGLLVAFRSDLLHEVTPVTRGERYTIVSWYH
jgi:SM-20-related protein